MVHAGSAWLHLHGWGCCRARQLALLCNDFRVSAPTMQAKVLHSHMWGPLHPLAPPPRSSTAIPPAPQSTLWQIARCQCARRHEFRSADLGLGQAQVLAALSLLTQLAGCTSGHATRRLPARPHRLPLQFDHSFCRACPTMSYSTAL